MFRVVAHTVERFPNLRGAYYEVWNEPEEDDDDWYWKGRPGSTNTLADYITLYVYTIRAIKAADPTARVGAPVTADWNGRPLGLPWGLLEFLRALKQYRMANPGENVEPDFIDWHDYCFKVGSDPLCRLSDGADFVDRALAEVGFAGKPEYILSEWNREWGNVCGNFTLLQHASHAAYNLIRELNPQTRRFSRLYWFSFKNDEGCRNTGLITGPVPDDPSTANLPECLRPAYAVFQMMNAMTPGSFVRATASDPLAALATRDGSARVTAIVNNNTATDQTIRARFNNLPFSQRSVTARVQRIDQSRDCRGLEAGTLGTLSIVGNAAETALALPAYSTVQVTLFSETSPRLSVITGAHIRDKQLIVFGNGFDRGAEVLVDDQPVRTRNHELLLETALVAENAAERIRPRQAVMLRVRNRSGELSPPHPFTRFVP